MNYFLDISTTTTYIANNLKDSKNLFWREGQLFSDPLSFLDGVEDNVENAQLLNGHIFLRTLQQSPHGPQDKVPTP